MEEQATSSRPDCGPDDSSELLALLRSLPGVSQTLQAITTFNIGPVTALLERAGYFPLLLAAPIRRGDGAFEVEHGVRRFAITTRQEGARIVGRNQAGGPDAAVRFRWRFVPDDFEGGSGRVQPQPPLPFLPGASQRIEVLDWTLRFAGGESGFRAYGTGRTLPGAGAAAPAVGLAFVLDVLEGYGELAGLAGTVVAAGTLDPRGTLELGLVARLMDPDGGLFTQEPLAPLPPGAGPESGVTWLTFLGQVDPTHPVTLRISLTQGLLGSNVFELLRVAALDFAAGPGGRLRSRATRGALAGSVGARLDFDPLSLNPITPIQTRCGVFDFQDEAGRSIGSVASNMIEGRSFRTRLEGMLLPVFRFGGFGPILGGTGKFAGARGIMTMSSVISVQPRTLSNLYILRLDDPDGRFRAAAQGASGGWAS
ncbi:MAG TPA: hypothetical protein VLR69_01955 [Thermoanaerobaculia bacterium]|nr:hypothetical protein [Thermoanaerobaculia bacterium]